MAKQYQTYDYRGAAERILDVLKPALRAKPGSGELKYETTWGDKTMEGLTATIVTILKNETLAKMLEA